MSNIRTLTRSFAGGEVTPEFWGRIDDVKYQTGLATCRNFIPAPHGPVQNRPGTQFVREVKDSTKKTRLIPFTYSTTQTMVIELGAGYFRFHTSGATLLVGSPSAWNNATNYVVGDLVSQSGNNYYCILANLNTSPTNPTYWYQIPSTAYEIPNPYAEADLFDIHYVQSSDVLTLVHPSYPPQELRRLGATRWTLTVINFATSVPAPATLTFVTNGGTTNPIDYYTYAVTAVDENGNEGPPRFSTSTPTINLANAGAYVQLSWTGVPGSTVNWKYNIYKSTNTAQFGFIGQTTGAYVGFRDSNIAEDLSSIYPTVANPFGSSGNYPGAVTYFEQRRVFAGTTNQPQSVWMSKTGTESNFNIPERNPRDDDPVNFKIAARESNTIRHLVPLANMMALSSSAEWRVTSINTDAITPTSISVRPQSYVGANNVQPVVVNNNLIFASARGGRVRELGFSNQNGGYLTSDLSIRAPHLFDGKEIVDMAFARSPQQVIWTVNDSGQMIGVTYVPDQAVSAWHQHDTDGFFESVAVVAEGREDALYVVVRRTINGATKRYVERFASRKFDTQADAFFVDCGLTYSGSPATVITGLSHLEGKTVSILADGAVHPQRVVTSGQITLDQAASKVHVGLPITAEIQTLPLAFETMAFGQGRTKNVNKVWLRVYRSSGIYVGPSTGELVEAKQRTTEPYGSAPALKSEEIPVVLTPAWQDGGQVWVRQSDPLPLTIVSMTMEVSIGA